MSKIAWVFLTLVLAPGLTYAQSPGGGGFGPGSGTDMLKVRREVEQMQRDGRWERLIEEGRANREAFEALRRQESVTATGSVGTPRRR